MSKNKYFLATLLAFVLTAGLFAGAVHAFAPANWYVGPAGDDTNDCQTAETACKTVNAAITKAAAGDTINVLAGTYAVNAAADSILFNKDGISLVGAGVDQTIFETSQPAGFVFNVSANGVSIDGVTLHKTDKAGVQNMIYVSGDGFTFSNNVVYGQFMIGDGDVSRAFEVTGGVSNFTVTGNTFHNLRQPGYLNGSLAAPTTGTITNNLVYNTKGWVIDGANMTFTGNTWNHEGAVNVYDVAILGNTPAEYYQDLMSVSAANNDAVIEDQRVAPAVLTVVRVDATATAGGAGGPSAPYQAISPAVIRAMDGGKIMVAAGTYTEQVKITHPVTLIGAGVDKTVVKAPAAANLVAEHRVFNGFTRDIKYIIGAFDADGVTVQDLSVNGDRQNTCAAGVRSAGVAMIDSNMTLTNAHIYDVAAPDSAFGCQDGAWQGVLAANAMANGAKQVVVKNVAMETFQKNGITAWSDAPDGLTVDIEGNTITSAPMTLTAQNGIQVSGGAKGIVKNNQVTGIFYTRDPNWSATGILVYDSSAIEVSGNQVSGAQVAMYIVNSNATVTNNVVTGVLPADYTLGSYWGIVVTDPPSAKPSPAESGTVRSSLRATSQAAAGVVDIVVKDNVVTGAGDHVDSIGIEADSGWDANDSNVTIESNRISGWGAGVFTSDCDPTKYTCSSSVFTGLAVHFNAFDDNTIGFQNDSAFSAAAENNWWGCNAGPGDEAGLCDTVAGTGTVVYDPWLVLTLTSDVKHVLPGTPAALVASLTTNSKGDDTSGLGMVMGGLPVTFTTEKGQLSGSTVQLTNGKAQVTLTADAKEALSGTKVTAQYDDQVVSLDLTIGRTWVYMPMLFKQ